MPVISSKSYSSIYQLKITLEGARPPIWRRVLVPGNFNLYKLHQVIQIAMGWTDSHLHQFIAGGEYFGIPSPEDFKPVKDERRIKLEKIAPILKSTFVYEYDFGDDWSHKVVVEKILTPLPGEKYPRCIKGKRACPPEDVGGIWGYENFLEAIQNPGHEEHEFSMEWIGGEFDPESLNLDEINEDLSQVK
jgi:hypothetical protein